MTILEIFEKVNLVLPIEQRRFLNYFVDSVNELMTLYDGFVFVNDATITNVYEQHGTYEKLTLYDDNVVLPLYHNAIVDNILFLASQDEAYKGEFIRKSKLAFLKYWNDNAKGKRVKRTRW